MRCVSSLMAAQWTYAQLRAHFAARGVDDRATWAQISDIVVLTLLALAADVPTPARRHTHSPMQVPACRNSFELFGFDVMIDADMRAWLIEVNLSPQLDLDTSVRRRPSSPLLRGAGRPRGEDCAHPRHCGHDGPVGG